MNRVLLVGRLTRDPELRTTPSGMAVTRFTIAVSRNFTNRNGERETDFINCSAWGRQADNISKYCHKGSLVSAEGRIRTGSYDAQDGTKRYTTEVACDVVNFLSTKSSNNDASATPSMPMPDNNYPEESPMDMPMESTDLTEDPFENFSKEADLTGLNEGEVNPKDLPFLL